MSRKSIRQEAMNVASRPDFNEFLLTNFKHQETTIAETTTWIHFTHTTLPKVELQYSQKLGEVMLVVPARSECAAVNAEKTHELETLSETYPDWINNLEITEIRS